MKILRYAYISTLGLMLMNCKEKYVPQLREVSTDYLVVDGFINAGVGQTRIELTRTTKVSAASKPVRETKAVVRVEGKKNTTGFLLAETSQGIYTHPQLSLQDDDEYRVYIKTASGKEYVSDYSAVRRTPAIDSVSWRPENDGVQIYIDAHDDKTPVGYYRFNFDETYIIHSRFLSYLKVFKPRPTTWTAGYIDSVSFQPNWAIYTCWRSDTSLNIQLYSTEKLTSNRVSLFPITFHERDTAPLSDRYSIHVRMYYMSRNCYQFYSELMKNTQQLGSIFDAQPSENNGNIRCLTNPAERVIGFVEVSEEKDQRIFIDNTQIPGSWKYSLPDCVESGIKNEYEDLQWIRAAVEHITDWTKAGFTDSVDVAPTRCVDCTTRGTNVKPTFWR